MRNDPHGIANPATISNVNDFNRDGLVTASDQIIARNNLTRLGNQLNFLVVGSSGPFAPGSSGVFSATPLAVASNSGAAATGNGDVGIASGIAGTMTVGSGITVSGPPPWRSSDLQANDARDHVFWQFATASSWHGTQSHAEADGDVDESAINRES